MNLLDENNFAENRNGRVNEAQLAGLKSKADVWFDLLALIFAFAFVGYFELYKGAAPTWVIAAISAGFIFFWLTFRLPAVIQYYFLALPDARAQHIAYATGKLAYHRGYVLQTDELRLSLPGDKNEGLLAGNFYEVCYLPRVKVALSARALQPVSAAQQAREFTLLFGQALGFTDEDIQANRGGEFTFNQKMTVVKRGWWAILLIALILALAVAQIAPMLTPPAFLDDAIIFTICVGGLAFFLIGVILISSRDAKNLLSLFERKLEQKEGFGLVSKRTTGFGKSQQTQYYLALGGDFELQISRRAYAALPNGLRYRVYFTSRFKYLAGLEVLHP
jgi:hypothetical protein